MRVRVYLTVSLLHRIRLSEIICHLDPFLHVGRYVEGVVLTSWLGERARGVVDLRTLASKGTARGEAIKANIAFIDSERDRLRALLFSAAMDEKLPYNDGPILDVFIANGGKEATAEELDALDMIEVD